MIKKLTPKEKEFARALAEGYGPVDSFRKVYKKPCNPSTPEYQKANDLAKTVRVKKAVEGFREKLEKRAEMEALMGKAHNPDWDSIYAFAFQRLLWIRDDPATPAKVKWAAITVLEQIQDPTQDVNLIWRYIDIIWDGMTAHCPCCHADFPLYKVKNEALDKWRKENNIESERPTADLDRRLRLFAKGEKRKDPRDHPGQLAVLSTPNRHALIRGPARCIEENEEIILADGRLVCVRDLKGLSEKIKAYGPLGEQITADAYFEDNGIKPVWELETASGRKIKRTNTHRIMATKKMSSGQGTRTQIGTVEWVEVQNLTLGHVVAVPEQLKIEGSLELPENEIKLLGYLLGDGGTTTCVGFTQKLGKTRDEFIKICEDFGCVIRFRANEPRQMTVHGKKHNGKLGKNIPLDLIKKWGLFGKRSKEKRFPSFVWTLTNRQLALMLNRLFACDGWAYYKQATPAVGIGLASEEMIRDVEKAMLRLGVRGRVRYKPTKFEGKTFNSWEWCTTTREGIAKFKDIIGIFGKEDQVNRAYELAISKNPEHHKWDTSGLPEGYRWEGLRKVSYIGNLNTVSIHVPIFNTFITSFVEHNCGKSFSLAILGFLHLLIPGVEIWLLSRVYDEAEPEFKYLEGFLRTAFYPVDNHMFTRTYDKKTGEAYIETKWGSLIKVKSGKAKGSITGHELEAILVAEPGWVDEDLFEEVRARMSSRLGRIFAFGTPKGFGGFLGRLMRTTTRDMRTGKRLQPGARLVENGCPWSQSIFEYEMRPEQNPEYVTSEIEAARSELTANEFASEFEGRMVNDSNLKFPFFTDRVLIPISRDKFEESTFVLGIDQGERNFGACLLAWDGEILRVVWEFFDDSEKTIKANLIELNQAVPSMVRIIGGDPESWKLTIFDSDPVIDNQLIELENENRPWKTPYTLKPKNRVETANWREETCLWVNEMAKAGRIEFLSEQTDLLHEQLREALIRDVSNDSDAPNKTKKRWIINDPWRGDHVCFHPETEVLTKDGWKPVSAVQYGELVPTRNLQGEIEYRPVVATISKDYDGSLIEYNKKFAGASFSVTPDHKLYVSNWWSVLNKYEKTEFIKAGDFYDGTIAKMFGVPSRSKAGVPGQGLHIAKYDPLSFSYFLGYFLADGCRSISGAAKTKYINIDDGNKERLEFLAKRLNINNNPYKVKTCWRLSIADSWLYDILGDKQLAFEKRIPRWFFDQADVQEHQELFNGLMDGDGTWSQQKYDSVSKGLADDFQELVSRLGVLSSVSYYDKKKFQNFSGYISKVRPIHRVRFRRSLYKKQEFLTLNKKNLESNYYKGKVYCISVPPYNNILTRRKGKTMWIGQCDAWLMACWTIYCNSLPLATRPVATYTSFEEQKRAQDYMRIVDERRELGLPVREEDLFKSMFGRERNGEIALPSGIRGHYSDEG